MRDDDGPAVAIFVLKLRGSGCPVSWLSGHESARIDASNAAI
jgi:hypothetical protein